MTNTQLLNQIINNKGIKKTYIAKKMGIARQTLSLKLNGKRGFNQYEIKDICDLLDIDCAQRDVIFFN